MYFKFCGHRTSGAMIQLSSCRQNTNDWECLYFSKTLFGNLTAGAGFTDPYTMTQQL